MSDLPTSAFPTVRRWRLDCNESGTDQATPKCPICQCRLGIREAMYNESGIDEWLCDNACDVSDPGTSQRPLIIEVLLDGEVIATGTCPWEIRVLAKSVGMPLAPAMLRKIADKWESNP